MAWIRNGEVGMGLWDCCDSDGKREEEEGWREDDARVKRIDCKADCESCPIAIFTPRFVSTKSTTPH